MSWRAAMSWMGRSPPPSASARASIALMAYSPLAEIFTRVPARGGARRAWGREGWGVARRSLGKVCRDCVAPGAGDAVEPLQHRALLVEPAELAGGADHRVLARHG